MWGVLTHGRTCLTTRLAPGDRGDLPMKLMVFAVLPLLAGCSLATKAATADSHEAQNYPAGRYTMTYDAAKKGVYVLDTRYGHVQFCDLNDDSHLVGCKEEAGVTG
jgi:hypothetical protein